MAVSEKALRSAIEGLVDYGVAAGMVDAADRRWAYNAVLAAAGAAGPGPREAWETACTGGATFDLEAALGVIAEAAVAAGTVEDSANGRDRAAMAVMGALMPRPSEVAAGFAYRHGAEGATSATDWFYRLCCDASYVRRAAIAKNVAWTTPTRWGDLEITINLSKPEKDPRDIAAAGSAPAGGEAYPACQLCMTNEGYPGRGAAAAGGPHPARQNLRIVPIELGGEGWGLQYSPYAYFDEHCIAMSSAHRPMHVDRENMGRLLDFVDYLPQYFVGSNADLPIVGGSILSHDHFQGGRHTFPMMRAAVSETFEVPGFADVSGEVLAWPMSVLRLRARNREAVLDASAHVLDVWRGWSDEAAGVAAHDADGTPHNTITPVARLEDGVYTMYLALRCNVVSDEHPLGVFHPHAGLHHIKKENIGLIEVMGLAILPPRLVGELAAVRGHLLGVGAGALEDGSLAQALEGDPLAAAHAAWALEVAKRHPHLTEEEAEGVLRDEVGLVFSQVLEDAGVFKWDDTGRAALHRFLAAL
ncbi:MAG: UDP-glucose--hexose-1-phosphate uridylyltransferase [Coriobacteriaceae bacterium]|nr:UDP-glucose--hexose-1-phosphate uridylyltransferase [Coriobacteriaceae bacterium]